MHIGLHMMYIVACTVHMLTALLGIYMYIWRGCIWGIAKILRQLAVGG